MYQKCLRFLRWLRSWFWDLFSFAHIWVARTLFYPGVSSFLRLRSTKQISMSDDDCEFDSTWEDECENKTPKNKRYSYSSRNMYAAKDMQDFRHSCKDLDGDGDVDDDNDDEAKQDFYNLKFYKGQIGSSPDNIYIDYFHTHCKGKYTWLEDVHSYIQWVFPLQECGVNWEAHVLTKKEIKHFRKDELARKNLGKSYEIMLDFYGIRLVNKDTGEVERTDNWSQRFKNLNRYSHNNLRITRILKCLGTLGLEHYQAPLVRFFLDETLVKGELPRVKQSVLDYFMFAVLDKSKRRELIRYAYGIFRPKENFVWAPKKILLKEKAKEGELERVKTHDSTNENNKTNPPEEGRSEKPCKNNPQDANENDQGANNENSQSSSNNQMVENQGTSIDCVVDMTPDNICHGDNSDRDESNLVESEKTNEKNMAVKLTGPYLNNYSRSNNENSQHSLENEVVKEQHQEMNGDGNNEVDVMSTENKPDGDGLPVVVSEKNNENEMPVDIDVDVKPDNRSNDSDGDSKKTTENTMQVGTDVDMEQDSMPDGDSKKITGNTMPIGTDVDMEQDSMPDGNGIDGDSKKTTKNDMPVGIDVQMKQDDMPDGNDGDGESKKTTENDMPGSQTKLAELHITHDQGSNDENHQSHLGNDVVKEQINSDNAEKDANMTPEKKPHDENDKSSLNKCEDPEKNMSGGHDQVSNDESGQRSLENPIVKIKN